MTGLEDTMSAAAKNAAQTAQDAGTAVGHTASEVVLTGERAAEELAEAAQSQAASAYGTFARTYRRFAKSLRQATHATGLQLQHAGAWVKKASRRPKS